MASFRPCPENLSEAEFKSNDQKIYVLICSAEGISRQDSIEVGIPL